MKHSLTTLYYPQMDRQTKRMIETITGILARIAETENNWDIQLPYALYTYHSVVYKVTKEMPFFMVYRRDPNRPLNSTLHTWRAKRAGVKKYTCKVVENRRSKEKDENRNKETKGEDEGEI